MQILFSSNTRSVLLTFFFATAMVLSSGRGIAQTRTKTDIPVMIPKKLDGGSQLDVRASPFVDMRFFVRAVNTGRAEAPKIEGFDKALAADKVVMETLPGLASGVFEADFLTCANATEAKERAATLQERASFPGIKLVNLRKLGTDLADGLLAIEPAYLAQVWPEHEKTIIAAKGSLDAGLIPRQRECLNDIRSSLGLQDPAVEIGVYLITSGPAPGSYTFRLGNGTACVIAIGPGGPGEAALEGNDLVETVLYQSTFALGTGVPTSTSVPLVLRTGLKNAGLPAGDCGVRELARGVYYAQAALTMRRVLAPDHVSIAEKRALLKECPKAWQVAKETWEKVAKGELAGEAAAKAAIQAYVGSKPEPTPPAKPEGETK